MLAETCVSLLRSGRPLHTVFGPYYKPEILGELQRRSRSPSPLQPRVAGLDIGFHMERRQYLSDPRMRDELMRLYHVCSTLHSAQDEKGYSCLNSSPRRLSQDR